MCSQEGNLILEPGPLYAKDGDKNRSESISYKILRGLAVCILTKVSLESGRFHAIVGIQMDIPLCLSRERGQYLPD